MKIDKKHNPLLFWQPKYFEFKNLDTMNMNKCVQNVYCLSSAVAPSVDTIHSSSKFGDLIFSLKDISRLVLFKSKGGNVYNFAYTIDNYNDFLDVWFVSSKNDRFMSAPIFYSIENTAQNVDFFNKNEDAEIDVDVYYGKKDFDTLPYESQESLNINLVQILAIEIFLQFAEIETKVIKPGHKEFEGVKCTYQNKSSSNITVVDSTWFTNLVVSGAFKVRGFFRLQPYGKRSENKRRLKWINEFTKHGYTRKAKKLNEQEQIAH